MAEDGQTDEPIEQILNRIPGALTRTQQGLAQARRGEGTPLDQLADEPHGERDDG
jgi:hypothetical protein